MKTASLAKKTLCIALVLILIGSLGACLLQTDFFNVKVKDLYMLIDGDNYSHALAFIPREASAENKVPVIVTSHGWLNSAEVQDAACIELSRRGIAVIAIDCVSHGMSSNDMNLMEKGMVQWVEYVASDMIDCFDTERIGIMGHSMGGVMTSLTLSHYNAMYEQAIEAAKAPDSLGGEEITEAEQAYADAQYKIDAALPTGNNPGPDTGVRCNYGILFGRYEEGGYTMSTGKANVLGSTPEALALVNGVDPSVTYVEDGKYYGNKEDGTLRVLYQPIVTHPLIHFDPISTSRVVEFFTYCWDIESSATGTARFFVKECFNLIAMVGLIMLLVPMADLLMSVPCFASLRGAEGPKVPALSPAGKKRFWFGWALTGLISFATAVISVYLTYKIPWPNDPFKASNIFPAAGMNTVTLWTVFNLAWGAIWFYINYKKDKAAGLRSSETIGLKITGKEFWKNLALAATVIGFMYAIVWFCKWLFNTDFRFWTPAIKTFAPEKLLFFIQYLPIFFAFYLVNSLHVNGANRFEGMSERKSLLICAFGNIIGCGLLWLVQYSTLAITGAALIKMPWCDVLLVSFCIWQLFLAPFLLRKFYKLTGNNWLGALVVSSLYVFCGVMNTAMHTQLF